jgi:putative hydrolase of the HAD superfamily
MESVETPLTRWVIFDADNTLWNVESLYDESRLLFCAYVEQLLSNQSSWRGDPGAVEMSQRKRDLELQETLGYSAGRFAKSFEDTLTLLIPSCSSDQVRHVRNLAAEVFERNAAPFDGLKATIDRLGQDYNLGIITAGEQWVQERRLATFKLRERFSRCIIVERKTQEVFENFCSSENVDRSRSWVVGDSVRSDIIPAVKAGLRAIHFESPNWAHESADRPPGVQAARTMQEVSAIILSSGS